MAFRMRLTVNPDRLRIWRELPERTSRIFRRKLVTVLGPELQRQVDQIMEEGPGEPSSPFRFNTPKSRDYWFYLVSAGLVETDGNHYLRTLISERGFRVKVSGQLRQNLITIRNIQVSRRRPSGGFPNAGYAFGPWLVTGHILTGWPQLANVMRAILQQNLGKRAARLYREAIREAAKGRE